MLEPFLNKKMIIIGVGNLWSSNYIEDESNSDRSKNLSVKESLNDSKPYLRDIIIDLQKTGTYEVQLMIAINFISSKDVNEECVMHLKSNNQQYRIYDL